MHAGRVCTASQAPPLQLSVGRLVVASVMKVKRDLKSPVKHKFPASLSAGLADPFCPAFQPHDSVTYRLFMESSVGGKASGFARSSYANCPGRSRAGTGPVGWRAFSYCVGATLPPSSALVCSLVGPPDAYPQQEVGEVAELGAKEWRERKGAADGAVARVACGVSYAGAAVAAGRHG